MSQAVSSEGNVFTLMIALCSRCAVFGAYLLMKVHHANAPIMLVSPLITANAVPLTFITKT